MTKTTDKISIRTDLLAAIAKWARRDGAGHLGAVVFRTNNTIVATDGHRLVIVPHETHGLSFGVARSHLLAAISAQSVLVRDGIDPHVGHDVIDDGDDVKLADGPYGDRRIDLSLLDATRVLIDIGTIAIRAPRVDLKKYPDVERSLVGDNSGTPDGYLLDARYLAAIEEVNTASSGYASGVRVVQWSQLVGEVRGPVVMENAVGVRFAIMPQRDKGESS